MKFSVKDFLVNVIKSPFFFCILVYLVKFTEEIFDIKLHLLCSEL